MKHSMKFMSHAVAAMALSIAFSSQAGAALYATGGGSGPNAGLSGLYTVDPLNGASTLVWNFQGIHIYAGGLAYDASTDNMYATGAEDSTSGDSRLFSINRHTGTTTSFGALSSSINISSGGLAINPVTGIMYASGWYNDGLTAHQSTALFTIDKSTGAAALIGFAGGNCCGSDFGLVLTGLGFRSDGTLFANGSATGPSYPDANTSHLFTVDLATGAAMNIGPSGVIFGRSLKYSGLAFDADGTLLSLGSLDAASGALYSINTLNGAATSLSGTGLPYATGPIHFGVDGGLTFAPTAAVPLPADVWLLGSGLLGLVGMARKKRNRR
jgi:hypothetical protein